MPYLFNRRRGLGYNPQIGSDGAVIDCDSFMGLFSGVCWNPTAPGVPVKVVTDPSSGAQTVQPDMAAAAAAVNAQTPILNDLPSFGLGVGTIAAIGAGVVVVLALVMGGAGRRR